MNETNLNKDYTRLFNRHWWDNIGEWVGMASYIVLLAIGYALVIGLVFAVPLSIAVFIFRAAMHLFSS